MTAIELMKRLLTGASGAAMVHANTRGPGDVHVFVKCSPGRQIPQVLNAVETKLREIAELGIIYTILVVDERGEGGRQREVMQ